MLFRSGGGAEIFDPQVRQVICHAKETAEEWLDVHRTWHGMGGRSTCTMLIGHVEQDIHRVDHLRQLRALQDETGGFTAFVPLAFHPANNQLSHLAGPSGYDLLKTLAIARIYLDSIRKAMGSSGKSMTISDAALDVLAGTGFSVKYGARFLKRHIDEKVKMPLTLKWKQSDRFFVEKEGDEVVVLAEGVPI